MDDGRERLDRSYRKAIGRQQALIEQWEPVIEAAKPIVEIVDDLTGDYPLKGESYENFERFRKAVYALFGEPENLCMCDECVADRAAEEVA